MAEKINRFAENIFQQFTDYYGEFLDITQRSFQLFVKGDLDKRVQDDLLRVQLYRLAIDKSVHFAKEHLSETLHDYQEWQLLREQFKSRFDDELATTYFTSVMRKVFAPRGIPVEFEDDGIGHNKVIPDILVNHYSLSKPTALGITVQKILSQSQFSALFANTTPSDIQIIVEIINENIAEDEKIQSLQILKPPFYRGKGAYLVGQMLTSRNIIPLIISCIHSEGYVLVDAVLVGHTATRSFLFSSTRSAFTVSTTHFRELYSFLQNLFPQENPAYIFDIIGFAHPAKISLLQQLRKEITTGEQFKYLGQGPVDFVFGVTGFPLVFKVIRRDIPNRKSVINNFIKVHTIDRLGQILDSIDYRNLKFRRNQFSDTLQKKLRQENPEDVIFTDEYVHFKRLYAARRITPVIEQVRSAGTAEARQILLRVGWNIKHLAAMGFFPKSLGLEHFGLTSWGRIVYLDNPSLLDIRLIHFQKQPPDDAQPQEQIYADPSGFEREINIPGQHRDIFKAIHGDLFSTHFWEEIKHKVIRGNNHDFFPYPSRYRLESRKFRSSVFEELQRVSDTADTRQIHMALNNLAVVDVELAGLSFLRLEVPQPSARVLVIEPIGPEIIAQLHQRFKDVTFDILQAKSEVVESDGQWSPGIHGKLNALVQVRRYDYVIGYVNETFDDTFFKLARLKGFLLLSTGTHNIDVVAATNCHTVVTNAPGPTTTTVAEQNIGLIFDALFTQCMKYEAKRDGWKTLPGNGEKTYSPVTAQLMWLALLRRTLKLDTMFSFGTSELYVRTGVSDRATVYHDQVGQNKEAGIKRNIGILGLNKTGLQLVEISIAHEISTIYIQDEEYSNLSSETTERFQELISIKEEISPNRNLSIDIKPSGSEEIFEQSDYLFTTEPDFPNRAENLMKKDQIRISTNDIFPDSSRSRFESLLVGLTLGIQGLGRIGEAVAERAIVLGINIFIHQRDPLRPKYQEKLHNLRKLATHQKKWASRSVSVEYAKDKDIFFTQSNVITTLAATTDNTRGWVDTRGLDLLGTGSPCPMRAIVSAGKGLVDENALTNYLTKTPEAEARLDVLLGEHEGKAYRQLVDDYGKPLHNIKITGHTAAAVREVRQLKIYKALDNLRRLIDGRIPPNMINNSASRRKTNTEQCIIEMDDLRFFRMDVPSPRARILVIEPLPPEIVLYLQQMFSDVAFDILLAESELIEIDGQWTPGINNRLNDIVSRSYDYCLGYCNANFDAPFFQRAALKGLILFATATHHIDLEMATEMGTIVTNSPGFTTVAVTEQNISMALDAVYGKYVQDFPAENSITLRELDIQNEDQARTVAQILWFSLLKKALRLDAMYEFGSGDKYVRTGVRRDATVYHDQLGQYIEAGISNSIGILGIDEVGLNLIELAIAFELSHILILEEEYRNLSDKQKSRLDDLIDLLPAVSQTEPFSTEIRLVEQDEFIHETDYTIKTPEAFSHSFLSAVKPKSSINLSAEKIHITTPSILTRSFIGLAFGVQGLGRIGEAVVQRALALGTNIFICQRNPERTKYQEKLTRLKMFAQNRRKIFNTEISVKYVDKETLFSSCNIVTTLAATTSSTRYWVDREALEMLGQKAHGSVRVLVNAGKGLLNEADLAPFLLENPEIEVRLDVLTDEQEGKAGKRFLGQDGKPLDNLKIAGHTAAAVPELRRLKILNALNNLRLHIDGKRPNNVLNP